MILPFGDLSANARYHWMTQAVIPRPIAWTLSENEAGDYNIAPFSYFNAVCSSPPLIALSFGLKPSGDNKDTFVNIRDRKHFVVHIADMDGLAALNDSSATLPYGESEVSRLNLPTQAIADDFKLPRIAAAPLALACVLYQITPLGDRQQLVFGEIQYLYAADETLAKDAKNRTFIDAKKVNPVARLSAGQYAGLASFRNLPRPE